MAFVYFKMEPILNAMIKKDTTTKMPRTKDPSVTRSAKPASDSTVVEGSIAS